MQVISLFSGIGGFEIAAEWVGWDNILSCEINEFGNKILSYYWPNAYHHTDIKTLNYEIIKTRSRWNTNEPTIIVGGFPCQGQSTAGKRKGRSDDRWLWPEMFRVISEVHPEYIVAENVPGIINIESGLVFEQVQADLETEGYEVQAYVLPACGVNAPHRRDRVWFVAHRSSFERNISIQQWGQNKTENIDINGEIQSRITSQSDRNGERLLPGQLTELQPETYTLYSNIGKQRTTPNTPSKGRKERKSDNRWQNTEKDSAGMDDRPKRPGSIEPVTDTDVTGKWRDEWKEKSKRNVWEQFPTQSPVCSRNDGVSTELVGITVSKHRNESIKAYGNAIVPQVVCQIFRSIEQYER